MLHIFRGGKTVAGGGQAIEFNATTIAQIAASYNAKRHEAPIVVGHPTDNGPAFGWVKRLVANGLDLYAEPDQMNPDFLKAVQQGAYKKISSSFYCPDSSHNPTPGNYHLRHVGFLGAMAPAIKGLEAVVFSDASDFVLFTEDYNMDFEELKSSLQALFDLIGPAMPDVDMGPAIEGIMMAIDGLAVVEAEEETPTEEMPPEFSERLAALVIREKAFEATQKKAVAKTIADFCETELKAGRMTNGEKKGAIVLLTMAANAPADYAEGGKSALELAMESYSTRAAIVPLGETSRDTPKQSAIVTFSDGSVDSTQLVSMARSLVSKNPDLSLEAAMEQIMEAA